MSSKQPSKPRSPAPELMAPAGNIEAAYAAFHFGADAVYLGLQKFSARADAENFSLEDLDRITAYARALTPRRKVFVALNTLILQSELKEVLDAIGDVADIGVDALIVQDLGVFRIAHRYFPALRLHASTQMAVHNLEGALALQDLGFHRVTLARELTIEEIREISQKINIETEFFAHGALCYSYSGLCLISSLLMGRSGNRGRCAYLCRDRFRTPDREKSSFLFSMKDLSTAEQIRALSETGVASLKIEGRKKSPLYVAATVHYYRKLLDGRITPTDQEQCESDIQTIFSRPWTPLHLDNPRFVDVTDPAFVGHRGTRVGQVEAVITRNRGHWLRFTTERELERYDGLQLELEGLDKPFGFSVEELVISPRTVNATPRKTFEARAGSRVEVLLPPHHPPIPKGAIVYCSSSQAVKRRYRYDKPKPNAFRVRRDLSVTLTFSRNEIVATAECDDVKAELRKSVSLNPARQPGQVERAAREAFEKTGETSFRLQSLQLVNPEGLFAPISLLNEIRRDLFNNMATNLREAKLRRLHEIAAAETEIVHTRSETNSTDEKWSIKIREPSCLALFAGADRDGIAEIVLSIEHVPLQSFSQTLSELAREWGQNSIRLGLPLITRAWERDELYSKIQMARAEGFDRWEATHVSAWRFLERPPARTTSDAKQPEDIGCDWSVYVLNRAAARQVLEMGARYFLFSPEDTRENVVALLREFSREAVVIVYQDTPLFISENCVRPALRDNPVCPSPSRCKTEPARLVSSHGDRLLLETRNCRTIVTGENPLSWSAFLNTLRLAGARQFRVDLSWRMYSAETALQIWQTARAGREIPNTHTGNFERGLL